MEVDNQDNHPTVKTLTETNPAPIVDVASASVTYKGYAKLGTGEDKPKWKIERITITGTVTKTEYADGNMNYDNIWADRASLTYSR